MDFVAYNPHCLNGSSAYLACCIKPDSITLLKLRPKKRIGRSKTRTKFGSSRDNLTGVCDMENSVAQSQGSESSINTSIQPAADTHSGVGTSNPPTEFVNHGLNLWNQTRQRWVGSKKQTSKGQQNRDPKLSNNGFCIVDSFWPCSWNTTYESLLGSNKPFSQPVPLAEMVDFLVDIWEQDGLYD